MVYSNSLFEIGNIKRQYLVPPALETYSTIGEFQESRRYQSCETNTMLYSFVLLRMRDIPHTEAALDESYRVALYSFTIVLHSLSISLRTVQSSELPLLIHSVNRPLMLTLLSVRFQPPVVIHIWAYFHSSHQRKRNPHQRFTSFFKQQVICRPKKYRQRTRNSEERQKPLRHVEWLKILGGQKALGNSKRANSGTEVETWKIG